MMQRSFSLCLGVVILAGQSWAAEEGDFPTSSDGKPLNAGFETGSLLHWRAEGNAFDRQPIKGDVVRRRRPDMESNHYGRYWIGTFERDGDEPQGTLTSVPFKISHPYASFLVGGGAHNETAVELVLADTNDVVFRASGKDTENMRRVAVDLREHQGRDLMIRVVDRHSGHWGHINFDDFRFHKTRPDPNFAKPALQLVKMQAGLSPTEAARAMSVPPGFHVTLFAGEPDVKQPIAFTLDDRGRLWVAEAYSYPARVPEHQAKDRILIFEDEDGDGRFDKRKVFIEGLNLVSGMEVGFGGVWVGAAPNLLFIPDKDKDDVPDGKPQVVLDGWGYQDTHETLNAFIWGPDGWLYGCHGVFTHSNVGKPGASNDERTPLNAGVWRYHPVREKFEVFAFGTSNPWGVDFNDNGECFLTACVIPHLFHMVQGGRYHRQGGRHFNPHVYDDIKTIADHLHYTGNIRDHAWWGHTPGVVQSVAQAGGGHAHAGAMIYLGGAWPDDYRGDIFMNNIHGARVNRDVLTPKGSGFVGSHGKDLIVSNDAWSQLLYFRYGPDGNVYMIDWYDKNQCHRRERNIHDRTNGRIFKMSYGKPTPHKAVDLVKLSDLQLVEQQLNSNDWYVRHSRRILQERAARRPIEPNAVARLDAVAFEHADVTKRLRALWVLHVTGNLDQDRLQKALRSDAAYVRGWAVRLACERTTPADAVVRQFTVSAQSDKSPIVRRFVASALQRLPNEKRWDALGNLIAHAEDANDHNLPLMYWYALEPLAAADPARALSMAKSSPIRRLLEFTVRRIGTEGTPDAVARLSEALQESQDDQVRLTILRGVRDALKGRRQVAMPANWGKVFASLSTSADENVRSQVLGLSVTFGLPEAFATLRKTLTNADAPLQRRQEALQSLLSAKDPKLPEVLQRLLTDSAIRGPAMRGLALYSHEQTPTVILAAYPSLNQTEKRDALNTLASRTEYAQQLLAAVEAKKIASTDLSADVIRQLRNLNDKAINDKIGEVWGIVRKTAADKARMIASYKKLLASRPKRQPDLSLGRAMFAKTCQQCHTLFATGGKVGPDITGSNRANLDYLLSNVLDPAAVMAKEYQPSIIATSDGRVVTGIVKEQNDQALTVVTANETLTLPAGEIEAIRSSDKSMMPDDLLKNLTEHQIRSLVAYLAGKQQVPMLATPENVKDFFNGQDLTGWVGDPKLWSVESGEIVGKSPGLKRNEFLSSDMILEDFRLKLEVKLTPDSGNSGVQFRSKRLPGGSVSGYQADVGAGWWGKLYEEHGRALLWSESGEKYVKVGQWNTYEIEAIGSRVRTWINGRLCVDLDDPSGAKRGITAFQLHSGGPMEVRYRAFEINLIGDGGIPQPAVTSE